MAKVNKQVLCSAEVWNEAKQIAKQQGVYLARYLEEAIKAYNKQMKEKK
jgi:hypothetical protein